MATSKDKSRVYRPPVALEVPGGRDLIRYLVPINYNHKQTYHTGLPRKNTPLGKYIKRYCLLYKVSFAQLAALMQSIDPEFCKRLTGHDISLWAEYGQMPTIFQFQTICYILNIKNPWILRPKGRIAKVRTKAILDNYQDPDDGIVYDDSTGGEDVKLPIEITLERQEQMKIEIQRIHSECSCEKYDDIEGWEGEDSGEVDFDSD